MTGSEANLPSVLVVEDDTGIEELLRFTLERGGYRVASAASAEEAERLVETELPDLAIIDWMLPGESGLALIRKLRNRPRTRSLSIIMVTARGEEGDRIRGLECGADDYVVKPFSPKELLARVQAVLRRRAPELGSEEIRVGPLSLDPARHEAHANGLPLSLAPAEFRLLRFLMANPGRVYSRQQLLDSVWGDHVYIEERTVDAHIRRLRVAIGVDAEAMIETVRGVGYKLLSPD